MRDFHQRVYRALTVASKVKWRYRESKVVTLNQILPLVFIENIPSRNLCIYIINANAQANTVSFFFSRFDRVKVVTAAASCLKKILATESGSALLKKFGDSKLEQLLWYLEPFRPSKKKRVGLIFLCCYHQFFQFYRRSLANYCGSLAFLWISMQNAGITLEHQ